METLLGAAGPELLDSAAQKQYVQVVEEDKELTIIEEDEGDDELSCCQLPPGFRFHPTDEEIILHYLRHKVVDSQFVARAIGEADLNKCEPWDLPRKSKMGDKEWWFFCRRDRKYPTGMRTNRAMESGYWKATGKDKEIFMGRGSNNNNNNLVGMKKTLVFYRGRAPKGQKSNWIMHEFRLEGTFSFNRSNTSSSSTSREDWVVCRVFHKNTAAVAGIQTERNGRIDSFVDNLIVPQYSPSTPTTLPPLTDYYFPTVPPGERPTTQLYYPNAAHFHPDLHFPSMGYTQMLHNNNNNYHAYPDDDDDESDCCIFPPPPQVPVQTPPKEELDAESHRRLSSFGHEDPLDTVVMDGAVGHHFSIWDY